MKRPDCILHFGASLVLLVVVLAMEKGFTTAGEQETSGKCRSGRLLLGSVNESYAEYIPSTGIYQQLTGTVHNKRSVYKHITEDAYLYFLSGRQFGQGFWAVGPQVGSEDPVMSVPSKSASPANSQQEWRLWNGADDSWATARSLKLACVDGVFFPCSSGQLLLTGISPRHAVQSRRMGVYDITDRTYSLRPVYKHRDQAEFLFYTYEAGGKWIVGPEVGKILGGLFVSDYALRPEYILQTWVVFVGKHFAYDQGVKVQCYGASSDEGPLPADGDHDIERPVGVSYNGAVAPIDGDINKFILQRRNNILGQKRGRKNDENLNDSCELDCQNGGRCEKTKDSIYLCICPDNYFGVNCQSAIDCGSFPPENGLESVSSTGHYFLDVVFYRCPTGTIIAGSPGVVCQADGSWSDPPRCLNGHHQLTPEHEETPDRLFTKAVRSLLW